jgi:hypothetical protein
MDGDEQAEHLCQHVEIRRLRFFQGEFERAGGGRNSLVAFSGDPRYGTATERLPSVAVRNASKTGKITGSYRKLF